MTAKKRAISAGSTVSQSPDSTLDTSATMELDSIQASGAIPASMKFLLMMRRFCMSGVNRHRSCAATSAHGIEDPEALFASFQVYVGKWEGLLSELEQPYTEEALTALLQEHLYGPIDVETWGLE